MVNLQAGAIFKPAMGDGSNGVVQVHTDGTNDVTLYGSVDGVTFTLIKTYAVSTDVIEEVVLCPFLAISADTAATVAAGSLATTSLGASTVKLDETRGR